MNFFKKKPLLSLAAGIFLAGLHVGSSFYSESKTVRYTGFIKVLLYEPSAVNPMQDLERYFTRVFYYEVMAQVYSEFDRTTLFSHRNIDFRREVGTAGLFRVDLAEPTEEIARQKLANIKDKLNRIYSQHLRMLNNDNPIFRLPLLAVVPKNGLKMKFEILSEFQNRPKYSLASALVDLLFMSLFLAGLFWIVSMLAKMRGSSKPHVD